MCVLDITYHEAAAGRDMCAICQEKMQAPILLCCSHIFCEDCVSECSLKWPYLLGQNHNLFKDALKKSVMEILTKKGAKTELKLGFRKPVVIMVVGVNGGRKTTSFDCYLDALKKSVLDIMTKKGAKTELKLRFRKLTVIMVVGVNGGGKTTFLGMCGDDGFAYFLLTGVT
ncbi:cell division protein FtsY homolog, chloroplastic [Tanacetum coccineum]|uniref:Cell division protein FtsY homolog, chloroplastic n=1 Tax=Tanacetum coccineum TaxID=301880 RepID=A0ABQ4WTX8_9ASTR